MTASRISGPWWKVDQLPDGTFGWTTGCGGAIQSAARRVQLIADRRFNRARYDADQMVAAFAARLKDAVDLDSVRDDLARVMQQALEPAHISVWVSQRR